MLQAALVEGFSQGKADLKTLPAGINPENVKFVREHKAVRRLVPTPLRFVGLEIADEFVVGYGLDHGERYRNLDRILAADRVALTADADAYEDELFGTAGGRVEG